MPFPVDHRGEMRWRGKTKLRGERLQREALHAVATALEGANGTDTVNGSTVSFTTEPGRLGIHSTLLMPIAHGSLVVTILDNTVVVAYTLNIQLIMAMASTLALGALAAVATSAEPPAVRIDFPALVWVVVFGVHYLITIVRFRAFIQRALDRM